MSQTSIYHKSIYRPTPYDTGAYSLAQIMFFFTTIWIKIISLVSAAPRYIIHRMVFRCCPERLGKSRWPTLFANYKFLQQVSINCIEWICHFTIPLQFGPLQFLPWLCGMFDLTNKNSFIIIFLPAEQTKSLKSPTTEI